MEGIINPDYRGSAQSVDRHVCTLPPTTYIGSITVTDAKLPTNGCSHREGNGLVPLFDYPCWTRDVCIESVMKTLTEKANL